MRFHEKCRWNALTTVVVISFLTSVCSNGFTAPPRVLPDGKLPSDRRLAKLTHLNSYFPFQVPDTAEQWQMRREKLRRRVLVATGLWPMPDKTPLKPVIHGRVEREGFTVEKVYFESLPNHFVTGLLFRPKDKMGKLPAVLCPHGHGGRLQDYGAGRMKQLIETGAEKFEDCGRYPKLSRCVQLARMGCVTFIFDMIGYADSVQITRQHAHGFSKQRPNFEGKDSWGLFSTQAELRLQSIMGLQTWNSIRALDFLCSLPDVDPKRVGVTGGSGGGTQTILLGAIDPRPVVTFPQGMVSTAMQGGCTCENCCLLRVGTGNVELTALFAPKPQAMTSANDWTKEMMTKGYPELKKLYKLLGAEDDVMCTAQLHFPHNYNYVTRRLMCNWFNKYLKLGLKEPVVEERWKPLTAEEWTVWNDEHPRPKGGDDYERTLTKYMAKQSDRQIAALTPKDEDTLAEFKKVVGGAFDTMIGRSWDEVGRIDRKKVDKQDHGSYLYFEDLVRTEKHGEELPMISFFPKTVDWNEQVVIWIDGYGKAGLLDDNGRAIPQIQRLLDAGTAVLSADLYLQGEFIESGKPAEENRVVSNPREYAGYTFGYNQTLFASRAHDILTLIKFVHGDEHQPKQIHLAGVNGAGPWVAAARAQAGAVINRAAIDTFGFRFADLTTYKDINFLPGAVKYGDLPALLALSAPNDLFIAGEDGNVPDVVARAYKAANKMSVTSFRGKENETVPAIVSWLLGK